MNQVKQFIGVSAILFASLLSTVALSYAITPKPSLDQIVVKPIVTKPKHVKLNLNHMLSLTIPRLQD